ncbi:myosin-9-like [Salvia splendens]|uniref:myosin-9-like n=1 Tax=Salvia splendens TaxID=180675 RepID=UPI001C26A59F|nr:myosin-9-like [Salvia splendens]
MAKDFLFTEEEMGVDEGLGYPKAFAKLCRDRSVGPFSNGPPYTFTPYALSQQEDARAKELDEMFPLTDPEVKPTTKPKIFLNLLWKQLNHLGNAGFDPEMIRVDPYGNVLYFHADASSPLSWDIDHWFPCPRGGLTVPSNLRILQWQVCRTKHNKLEFLIPWWDLQVGISINQFLSIFASSNSDFRRRAFSWLFYEGESEELNASQAVISHIFPQHFLESEGRLGLAPAAVVQTRRESLDDPVKSLDHNRRPRSNTPILASVKRGQLLSKENESALMEINTYQAIVMARDSLKQREEASKMQAEIHTVDNEACELLQKTEEDKLSILELELVLVKKRRRAEKCRRLAESQSSYRVMLEKMIRDAMHQSVVYKEQVRLNQAAASALMARLEAQKAICDSAERELHVKHRQRDELEKQIRPEREQARKRTRMDDTLVEADADDKITLCLPEIELNIQQEMEENEALCAETVMNTLLVCLPDIKSSAHSHNELRKLLEEERRPLTVSPLPNEGREVEAFNGEKEATKIRVLKPYVDKTSDDMAGENEYIVEERLEKLETGDEGNVYNIQFPFPCEMEEEEEEDEESRIRRGKGNIEKWMQFLLENTQENAEVKTQTCGGKEASRTDEPIEKVNKIYPLTDIKDSMPQKTQCTVADISDKNSEGDKENGKCMANINTPFKEDPPYKAVPQKITAKESASPDEKIRREKIKERGLARSESTRAFRRVPSSPSLLLEGMKKRVDCIVRRKSFTKA